MKLLAGSLFVTMLVSGVVEVPDTYPKNPDIDAINYTFKLSLSDGIDEIVGEATVDLRFLVDGISEIRLDLINQGEDGRGMAVTGVTAGGESIPFRHEGNELLIRLPIPSRANQSSQYTIRYRGVPATGLVIGDNKHGDRTFSATTGPTRRGTGCPR